MIAIDRVLGTGVGLPLVLMSTVASARSVLSTIATATISVAGIATRALSCGDWSRRPNSGCTETGTAGCCCRTRRHRPGSSR
ncbi:hypothetical protein PA7_27120 [Pseudonocardia asaccharolytica DSM 44247 = NBRC 16224]|uniref:Uncharacterized protein n=1 Tax=Pseudonocardia asaccharolytica DSM 44247 = NBRC 16224 TaxID=1123024 RepID=A0A511D270_9PSEU|nr:hypothetical protein PA7_27120 [Pseudonocardia asaccharolytica DSM 44247 = NBRC 16224]